MNELDEALVSLKASHQHVTVLLLAASAYVDARAAEGDTLAAWLSAEIGEAFTSLRAENIGAGSLLEEASKGAEK